MTVLPSVEEFIREVPNLSEEEYKVLIRELGPTIESCIRGCLLGADGKRKEDRPIVDTAAIVRATLRKILSKGIQV